MNSFIDKVASLLPALEARETIYLFALAEREDINLWDIVISSDQTGEDEMAEIRFVVNELQSLLEPEEINMISRVAVIPPDDPNMQGLPASLDGVVPQDEKVVSHSLLGSEVSRAFIFKANHPPKAASHSEVLAGSAAQI